jgi:subtilisin family serine protease
VDQPNRQLLRTLGILLALGLVFILSVSLVLAQTPSGAPSDGVGLPAVLPGTAADGPPFAPGVVLIQLEADAATVRSAAELLASFPGARNIEALTTQAGAYRIAVDPGSEIDSAAQWMQDPGVRVAEPDYLFYTTATPNDTLYTRYQWNLRHIRADQGWDRTAGSSEITIAIVDTGVDLTHPDLVDKVVAGYDWVNDDTDPADDQGHGTHVASIAAASSNNGQGIAGVAWGAHIMPIKVLNANGAGYSSDVAEGITWAVDQGADIINLSLGGSNYSDVVASAIQNAHERGVLVIAAAGNQYKQGNPITYPAAYNHVLAVAATNDQDGHASYSSSGSYIDVAAPGGDPNGSLDNDSRHWIPGAFWRGSGISYAWLSGTSQAAPHVAGLAALLLSINRELTPDQLSALITNAAVDVQAPGWDEFSGHGRIDVSAALDALQTVATNTPSPTPTWTATPTATPSPTPLPPALLRPREDRRINSETVNHQADAALVEDGQGNLTSLWRDGRNGDDALYSAHLTATGQDWGVNLLVTGTEQHRDLNAIRPPFLTSGTDGVIHAIWQSGRGSIYYSKQGQAGASWTPPLRIHDEAANAVDGERPVLAVARDGTLLAVWADGRDSLPNAATTKLYWSERLPGSNLWSTPTLGHAAGDQSEAALAVGEEGIYIAWINRHDETATLMVAHKGKSSSVWSPPTMTVPLNPAADAYTPTIIVDPEGKVTLAWSDQRWAQDGFDIFVIQFMGEPGSGASVVRVNNDRGTSDQRRPQLAVRDQGLVLVWEDERLGDPDIFVSWQAPGSQIWSPNRRANQDGAGIIQRAPGVVMDAAGHTTIVWTDYRTGNSAPEIYTRFLPFGERFSLYLPSVTSHRQE